MAAGRAVDMGRVADEKDGAVPKTVRKFVAATSDEAASRIRAVLTE